MKNKFSAKDIKQKIGKKIEGTKLTLLNLLDKRGKHYEKFVLIQCDCGTLKKLRLGGIINGETKSCGCLKHTPGALEGKAFGKNHPLFKGFEEISQSLWCKYATSAAKRNIAFNLSVEEGWNIFLSQKKLCALSGIPLSFSLKTINGTINTGSASLDRIDSNQHYYKENVQWVHKKVNKIKSDKDQTDFIDLCIKITNFQKVKKDLKLNQPIEKSFKRWFRKFSSKRKRDKTKKCSVTIEYLWNLYLKQNRQCALSGENLKFLTWNEAQQLGKCGYGNASLDRIDSSKDYIEGNVQFIHKQLQNMKWDILEKEFLSWCKAISDYQTCKQNLLIQV